MNPTTTDLTTDQHAPAGTPTRPDQAGNAMILMPAGVLVMLVLAAIAVDVALLNRTQAALENLAAAVANDVASSVQTGSLFDDDDAIAFDPDLLDDLADRRATASGIPGATCVLDVQAGIEPTGRPRVRVARTRSSDRPSDSTPNG